MFRNVTVATGNYVVLQVTTALSLTVTSGSTLGTTSSVPFKVWIVAFNDASTVRLGVINCLSGVSIYPLGQVPIASATAEGGAGGADSAQVFYANATVTSKAYEILGYASYESGLTAGAWASAPTRLQLFGTGVPLPGTLIQYQPTITGAQANGTTQIPEDDTIPQITEGDEYMTRAISPSSAANVLLIDAKAALASNSANRAKTLALFQDATTNALATDTTTQTTVNTIDSVVINYAMLAATTSSTTFRIRAGANGSGTTTFNGSSSAREYGGTLNSYLTVRELMA